MAIAAVVLVAIAAGVAAWWFLIYNEAPVELTSAWPVADAERVVPKPPDPPRWPLTGEDAESPEETIMRPIAVKVENTSASKPQTGLQSADVVYESVTEGGITRFNAIFHSDVEGVVGNIRSARLSEAQIVPQYNALLVFSGAASPVHGKLRNAGVDDLSEDAGVTSIYYRSRERRSPHNLYAELEKVYPEAEKRSMATTGAPRPFQFVRGAADASETAEVIKVPFSDSSRALWTYDPEADAYLREDNGRPHIDAETGEQITADNVVIMWTKYTAASRDSAGSTTYDIQLTGEGRGLVLRNGQVYNVTWVADAENPPRFKDESGAPVRLAPGNTWFQVVSTDVNVTTE
jgi:hypothetical protein